MCVYRGVCVTVCVFVCVFEREKKRMCACVHL